ncbi:MAG TPA: hypothetical protein VHK28_07155 [Candidatus Limnocylindria bacterium]|nr:hypothetical protein [Candidatus Limnocylindria bacterium]
MSVHRVGDLEVEQDLAFQRREWIAERIGWTAMLVLAVAGVLGLFGTGPLAAAEARGGNGLLVDYGRFERFNAPAELIFEVPAQGIAEDGTFSLALARDYLDDVEVEQVTPEPDRVRADGEWLTFSFASATPQTVTVVFHLQHDRIGPTELRVRLGDGEPMAIGQFIYP